MLLASFIRRILQVGTLNIIDPAGKVHRIDGPTPGPTVTIRVHDRRTAWRLVSNSRLAFGEAYMDGTLTVENGGTIFDFLDMVGHSMAAFGNHPLQVFATKIDWWVRGLQQYNPIGKAQKNVAHHYDLSGALYDLFLDADRQYSCAYFLTPQDTLEQAQAQKKRHIAAKLLIEPGQKLLDIGCGWGGLGLYLAQQCGADVTGVTLSVEQQKMATQRAADAGMADRARFLLRDYRQDNAKYDRIVSVGMFEHVGAQHYVEYFKKVKDLLSEDGVFLLHAIGRMEPPGTTNKWLRKYIFPGGYSPAMSEVVQAIEKVGLWVTDIEVLRLHYAYTLKHWRERFAANRDKAKALYDERFCRMWEFYLAGCEISFRYLSQFVFQMQITRRLDAVPLTRDYMVQAEHALQSNLAAE